MERIKELLLKYKSVVVIVAIIVVLAAAAALVLPNVIKDKKKEEAKAPEACEIMTINKYEGLEIEAQEAMQVTDEDIENDIKTTMDAIGISRKIELKKEPVENGDVVVMDYEGKKDGVAFEGGSAEDYSIVIGSGTFIPGFEEGIIGHKKGEKFKLDITFPEDYHNADLAGQPVVFTVKIKKVSRTVYPKLTDEVATQLNGDVAITVDEYREKVKENLTANNEESLKSTNTNLIWQALMEECEVEAFPEKHLQEKESELNSNLYYMAQQYGYSSLDAFVLDYYGVRTDILLKDMLRQEYAIQIIAYEQGLKVTEELYQKKLVEYAENYGYDITDETSLKEFEDSITRESLEETLLYEMVSDYLLEKSVKVEKKTETEVETEVEEATE